MYIYPVAAGISSQLAPLQKAHVHKHLYIANNAQQRESNNIHVEQLSSLTQLCFT